jgi:hypothetical protein
MYSNQIAWKWRSFLMALTARGSRLGVPLLFLFALVLGAASSAQAAKCSCSDYGGIVDGFDPTTYAAIESCAGQSGSSFVLDMNCTIKNFPQSLGGFPINNINFQFPNQAAYFIIFDNVYYYGHMACSNLPPGFWIYWTPGGFNNINSSCQAFMVPVDAAIKQDPPAQTSATIGVPFTYTTTAPYLGSVSDTGFQYVKMTTIYKMPFSPTILQRRVLLLLILATLPTW